jgi:hypothetical protein
VPTRKTLASVALIGAQLAFQFGVPGAVSNRPGIRPPMVDVTASKLWVKSELSDAVQNWPSHCSRAL